MKHWINQSAAWVMFLALAAGCQGMRAKTSPDFIQPLASNQAATAPEHSTPETERELCIRTAATVASRGHFTEAIALYERAETLDPTRPPLDRELAPLYAEAGHVEQAVTRYQRAARVAPDDTELLNNFAWALIEAGRATDALDVVQSALQHQPESQRLKSTRAVATYRAGNRDAALAQFTALYGAAAAYHNIALLDVEAGDRSNAHSAAQQSLAHQPTDQTTQLAAAIEKANTVR